MNDFNNRKVPVMLLFFNRPDTLTKVFEAIRKYKPTELFLVQDGARANRSDDIENIEKCREIVEYVDWECNIHRNYATNNMSCDHREYTGIAWCFKYVDRLIILEDDCVPSQSFFKLCEECLEKYKDHAGIHSIVGFNRVGNYEAPYDYVFSMTSAGLGWATWRRVWEKVESIKKLDFLDSAIDVEYLDNNIDKNIKDIFGEFIPYMRTEKENNLRTGKISSWEKLVGFTLLANNMLTITPCKNMVKYIGISENATHCLSDPRMLPYKTRNVLMQPAYDELGDIVHPPFIVRDTKFEKKSGSMMKYPPYIGKIESLLRRFWYGKLCK